MKNLFKLPCALVLFGLLTNACQKDKMLNVNEPTIPLNLSGKYVNPSTPPRGNSPSPQSPKTPTNQKIPNNTPQAPKPDRTGTSTFTQNGGRNLFGNRVDHNNNVIPQASIGRYGQNGQAGRNQNQNPQNNVGRYTLTTPPSNNYTIDLSQL